MHPAQPNFSSNRGSMRQSFRFRYMLLIILSWTVPPVFGLSYLVYINMFSFDQMLIIMTRPLEPLFITVSLVCSAVYFYFYAKPLFIFERVASAVNIDNLMQCMRRFPLHYWAAFLAYLLIAPSTVIISAKIYTGYMAQPIDWLRIHLVALIVSIIVGLPLFFLLLDSFGRLIRGTRILRPHLTIKTKVFMIGALTPLLLDTMLVQYYWSRTGYFSIETFWVWFSLELIAVGGALMFVRSFRQSMEPLNDLLKGVENFTSIDIGKLNAQSTDELGVLSSDFQSIIKELHIQEEVLQIRNRLLANEADQSSLERLLEEIVSTADHNLVSNITFIMIHDEIGNEMVNVCYTGHPFLGTGYDRIPVSGPGLSALVYGARKTLVVDDASKDARANAKIVGSYDVCSAIAVPMMVHDVCYGVLITCTRNEPAYYGQRDVRLTEALAQEAALVINTINMHYSRLQAERELSVIFDNMQDTFFRTDREGRIIRLSESVQKLLGYAPAEMDGRAIGGLFVDPEGGKKFIINLRSGGGTCRDYYSLLRRKDGGVVWVSTNAQYYYGPDGEALGVEGISRNVTDQKNAEDALFQEKERAQVTLASIGDGVVTTDTEGQIDYVNPVAEQILGVKFTGIAGQRFHEAVLLVDSESRIRLEDPVQRCLAERRAINSNVDALLLSQNGVEHAVEFTASPIRDRTGQTIGVIMVMHDVTEMRRLSAQLSYQANHDSLTGLFNRREFESRLEGLLGSTRGTGGEHALCYMDLDRFKLVNDSCGHMAGDELLRQLSVILRDKVRKADTLARLGGDEFGVLLANCPAATAKNVAEGLRQAVRDYRFTWEGRSFDIGASIGLVAITPESGSITDLLSAADNVCYMAKENGRDRIQVYEPDDATVVRRYGEARWVSRLNDAIENNAFCLYGQEIVSLGAIDDRRRRQEVLIRLDEGNGRLIPPMAFIPAAERYYMMPMVDRWVINRAFSALENINRSRMSGETRSYAINLSGQSLSDDGFLAYVVEMYRRYGLKPQDICFEITETAAIANLSQASRFISVLHELGCEFSLDDFGSGLSSFAYLKNLNVDYLKIDGAFIRDMRSDPIDREMVEAINKVGHVMGIKTIAEYVEDADTLALLREIGVDYVQGFSVSAPKCICDAHSGTKILLDRKH